jgi:hypothetical protein
MCLRNELRSALRRLLVTGMLPLAAGAASAMSLAPVLKETASQELVSARLSGPHVS